MTERNLIRSGDLLIWSNDDYSTKSDFYLNLIRLATRSEFAHTAIAWRLEGRLMLVEATQPVVRLNPVRDWDRFYHIPMGIEWGEHSEQYLLERIGCVYSFLDALRAYLGKTVEKDDRYQCAELCHEFYKLHGIDLGEVLTPTAIVKKALEVTGSPLHLYPSLSSKPALRLL